MGAPGPACVGGRRRKRIRRRRRRRRRTVIQYQTASKNDHLAPELVGNETCITTEGEGLNAVDTGMKATFRAVCRHFQDQ